MMALASHHPHFRSKQDKCLFLGYKKYMIISIHIFGLVYKLIAKASIFRSEKLEIMIFIYKCFVVVRIDYKIP